MSESSHQSASRVAQSRRSVPKIGTTIAPTIGNSMEGASPEADGAGSGVSGGTAKSRVNSLRSYEQ